MKILLMLNAVLILLADVDYIKDMVDMDTYSLSTHNSL